MASTFVNNLRLEEMATGEQSGNWGTKTNTNLELIGEALGFGTEAITTNANTHTTTVADASSDAGRAMYIKYTGTLDSTCTITIAPNTMKRVHVIENATSGSQDIAISQGSGANVTIPAGMCKVVYLDGAGSGAAVVDAFASLEAGTLQLSADTSSGDAAALGYTSGEGLILTGQGSTSDVTIKNDADGSVLTVPTGTTNVDIVGDVTAATINADGDTSSGDNAAMGYTASEGLILTGQGSTNDITVKNDADADVLVVPTGTTNVDIVGVATAATFEPDGDTAAGDNAAIGYTASEGLILTGQGSSTDVTIKNDADATVASIATGTTTFTLNDDVDVDGRATGTQTTDNDGNFDLSVSNFFKCTPTGDFTLTLSNPAEGQSGTIMLVNTGGHTVSAHASVAINADILTALSRAGTYMLNYYCSASSGDNTILVGATGALT